MVVSDETWIITANHNPHKLDHIPVATSRMEMFSLLFKRFDNLPVIVVKGGDCEPYMISPTKTMARPPGSGVFTCCMRDHKMTNSDGTKRGIPCDKVKIGQLVWTMLQKKLSFMLGSDQLTEHRLWLALVPHFMNGLPDNDAALEGSRSSGPGMIEAEDAVKDFLATYHFKTTKDEEGRAGSGLTPLGHAAMVGNVVVAAELIKQGADVHCKLRKFNTTVGADIGATALHFAVSVCPARQAEMIAVLLRAGADANAPSNSGGTPLMAGVTLHHVAGVKALLECAKDTIDLERGLNINDATALSLAAYMGTPELCEVLINAGASRKHINDHGGTKLHDACGNVATTKQMLDVLWSDGELDINAVQHSKTMFWTLCSAYFQMGVRHGFIAKSHFAMNMAHSAGSTPLHKSANKGLVDVTDWLLQHGAHKSLYVRDEMGATPLDVARIFGPNPAIEAKLGAAMINHQFGTQFAIRRGSQLRDQAARGATEPEEKESEEAPPLDESRPAEPTPAENIENNESAGVDGTAKDAVVGTDDAVRNKNLLPVNQIARVPPTSTESPETVDVRIALATLSSGVEARFDKQGARSDEQVARLAVRFDEQAARLDALQSENAGIMAKLDLLIAQQLNVTH